MSFLKIPMNSALKARRIPNAFMLFVKEQKKQIMEKCPLENKAALGALLGQKWRSMAEEEKRVYFDKYKALKKLEADNSDLSSIGSEKTIEYENTLKSETDGILTYAKSTTMHLDADETGKENKRKSDAHSTPVGSCTIKKRKTNLMSSPGSEDDFNLESPEKSLRKKVRRSPNAFMIFAKEQRSTLGSSDVKDKKSHANTVLGQMWRSLSDSEKEKYFIQAREVRHLYKNSDTSLSPKSEKVPRRVLKVNSKKKTVKKSVGRPSKKVKEVLHFAAAQDFKSIEANVPVTGTNANASALPETTASGENITISSEPRVSSDFPSANYLHHHNSIISSRFQRMPQPVDHYQTNPCNCPRMFSMHNSNGNGLNHSQIPETGMSRSCYGSGFMPPFFPSYPFGSASAFYMYNQAMAHQMYAFPCSQSYPPTHFSAFSQYNCCNPYYPAYPSSYFNSFFAGRCNASIFNPSSSATNKDESANGPRNDESSNDEMLVVDESVNTEQQLPDNETDQHE